MVRTKIIRVSERQSEGQMDFGKHRIKKENEGKSLNLVQRLRGERVRREKGLKASSD